MIEMVRIVSHDHIIIIHIVQGERLLLIHGVYFQGIILNLYIVL